MRSLKIIFHEKLIFLNYYFRGLNMAALWNSEIVVVTEKVKLSL
jgi:hypothetical protein